MDLQNEVQEVEVGVYTFDLMSMITMMMMMMMLIDIYSSVMLGSAE